MVVISLLFTHISNAHLKLIFKNTIVINQKLFYLIVMICIYLNNKCNVMKPSFSFKYIFFFLLFFFINIFFF